MQLLEGLLIGANSFMKDMKCHAKEYQSSQNRYILKMMGNFSTNPMDGLII